jgi:DnaA family protein
MRQLALDVRLDDHAIFDTFHPGGNAKALHALRGIVHGAGAGIIWLWGATGTGKSHLLQAAVVAANADAVPTAYLPMHELRDAAPEALDGVGALSLIALDDVGEVAGDVAWERALFLLYETVLANAGRLIIAAATAPAQAGFQLPDLVSRFSASTVFRLQRMTDEECLQALQLRAQWRGLVLPDETGRYLLGRVERSPESLFQWLDRLDRAALEARKPLTVPFVRGVLDATRF